MSEETKDLEAIHARDQREVDYEAQDRGNRLVHSLRFRFPQMFEGTFGFGSGNINFHLKIPRVDFGRTGLRLLFFKGEQESPGTCRFEHPGPDNFPDEDPRSRWPRNFSMDELPRMLEELASVHQIRPIAEETREKLLDIVQKKDIVTPNDFVEDIRSFYGVVIRARAQELQDEFLSRLSYDKALEQAKGENNLFTEKYLEKTDYRRLMGVLRSLQPEQPELSNQAITEGLTTLKNKDSELYDTFYKMCLTIQDAIQYPESRAVQLQYEEIAHFAEIFWKFCQEAEKTLSA